MVSVAFEGSGFNAEPVTMPPASPPPAPPSRRRPRIGICSAVESARWGAWETKALLTPRSYVDAVQHAGGLALLLAPDPALIERPDEALDLLDGLILAGGTDVDPVFYGARPHRKTQATAPERDAFEIALARRALTRDLPLLGICRGMQVMNVARGGTLIQHLPDVVKHEEHRRTIGSFDGSDHDVRLAPLSVAAQAAGEIRHSTKSHHHQGVADIGLGLTVTGWATLDDLPEAIEDRACGFALGVQWHPEADPGSRVVAALVDAARQRLPLG